jgi:hypothetical protein
MFQQEFDHLQVAASRRGVQGGPALGRIGVAPRRVGAAFEQQADDLEMAEFGGGFERRPRRGERQNRRRLNDVKWLTLYPS